MGDRHRRSSRVLVFDEHDRILMFLTKGSVPAQRTRWLTPGGGVDAGESHHEAACRELFEETGLVADDLGDPVWSIDFDVDYVGGDHDTGHAEYYLLRTITFTPSSANWTESEQRDVLAHRWWSLAELRATDEAYEPDELSSLVARFATSPETPSTDVKEPTVADPQTARDAASSIDTDGEIAMIARQERELLFLTFTNSDALELGGILVGLAIERGLPVTVDIRRGEQQLFHAAMEGTAAHNDVWINRKIRTVRELGTSSRLAGLLAQAGGTAFHEQHFIDPLLYAGHGGGFPVIVQGVGLVGTIAVSGLPQRADHALAVEAIELFLARRA